MIKLRITVDAIDKDEVHHEIFESQKGESPEETIMRFDEWVEEHCNFEPEAETRSFFESLIG